jgi:hypothetical protein
MRIFFLICGFAALLPYVRAEGSGIILSPHSTDNSLTADPNAQQWKNIRGVVTASDSFGKPVPRHQTEIRSRWTNTDLHFLYICPYDSLNLKPNPSTGKETNHLWDWDVAEVFIAGDPAHVRRYKEFEMSPQGEWVDLDIDKDNFSPDSGWLWNSGFQVKARVDKERKIWYGEMRIPIKSVDQRQPEAGREMRVNFYRCQGAEPGRKYIAWQPTNAKTFHVPESFGLLRLVK